MAHHGDNPNAVYPSAEARQAMMKQLKEAVGPTGSFPEGKLNENDEGEIAIGITHKQNTVILNFGKPVAWIGFTPQQAKQIGLELIRRAQEAQIINQGLGVAETKAVGKCK